MEINEAIIRREIEMRIGDNIRKINQCNYNKRLDQYVPNENDYKYLFDILYLILQ